MSRDAPSGRDSADGGTRSSSGKLRASDARGSSPPPEPRAPSEVKGLWFVTARRYTLQEHGEDALRAVLADLPDAVRPAFADPLPSGWYPETHLQACLDSARRVLAGDDADRMLGVLQGCTVVGINAFWRTALRLTSAEFAIRALPVSWRHMRRGPGSMSAEVENGLGRVHYEDFPFFDDSNYRLLVLGTLRPLLAISLGREVPVNIVSYTSSSLTAHVRLRE